VRAAASKLSLTADGLSTAIAGPMADISKGEHSRPWGHDKYGLKFDGALYAGAPSPATAAYDLLGGLATRLSTLAGNADAAMLAIETADSQGATGINAVAPRPAGP
jgi:hypothetical protein